MWGTYWMAWGVLQALAAAHTITIPPLAAAQTGFAVWFIPLAVFTCWGAVAAVSENLPLFVVLGTVGRVFARPSRVPDTHPDLTRREQDG